MKHNGRLKVKFDFSFFAVVAFMIFVDTSGAAVLSLIACILHEGGHLLTMAVCGANPERITFYGGGIARLVILSAGCSVNLLVAAACFAMQGNDTAAVFGAVNLIICIFNALPIGYFDGAEVLELLLTGFVSLRTAEKVKKIVGTALALIITAGVIVYCVMCGESVSLSLFFVVLFLIQAQLVS